jgi:hypothetical protein
MEIRRPQDALGGGWFGADLMENPGRWQVELPAPVRDELVELAGRRAGRPPSLDDRAPEVGAATAEFVSRLRDMYTSGYYFAVVTGFPHEPLDIARDAYWLLGLLLGDPVPQSPAGSPVGHLEDVARPDWQYESSMALDFHNDPADLVGMLCIRPAPVGGVSYLVSARTVHDLLLAEAPDLLAELYRPLQQAWLTVQNSPRPWTAVPVFGFAGGDFSMRYDRGHIFAGQEHAATPQLTSAQVKAMDALDEIMARPGVALEMTLQPGEFEVFSNAEVVHARSEYGGAPEGQGRLLIRLSLSYAESPELPAEYRELYGATAAGTYRGGAYPDEKRSARVGRPIRRAAA